MKIRFIQTLSTSREVYRCGHDYEIPDAVARSYVAARVGVEAIDPPPAAPPKQATASAVRKSKRTSETPPAASEV